MADLNRGQCVSVYCQVCKVAVPICLDKGNKYCCN